MNRFAWRTVDIVVASVIAVAFGVVFWAWNQLWLATTPAFTFYPPAQGLIYGVWLVPAVLGAWIIRKPGAALYCEWLAAIISVALGNAWGGSVIWQGLVQGIGAELVFLIVLYRVWTMPVALLAAAASGIGAALWDTFVWWATADWATFRLPLIVATVVSAIVIAGFGSPLLARALAATGVLDRFPAGRSRALV
ncbi:ECF transporter S component [Allorhizocola rhizosphaerae]|uniref:ECF transporter S component n=1 Tax=Allorhizocola rhizosphaerae TaxID=1872709 RepID=UPI000E3E4921|nr:ECF transporter S component [Allorhizocola rhizosphaerae]